MVSHDIERALGYADTVVEIENGSVVYNGDVEKYHSKHCECPAHHDEHGNHDYKKSEHKEGGAE